MLGDGNLKMMTGDGLVIGQGGHGVPGERAVILGVEHARAGAIQGGGGVKTAGWSANHDHVHGGAQVEGGGDIGFGSGDDLLIGADDIGVGDHNPILGEAII